jgi:diaminopimelate decarboxylase
MPRIRTCSSPRAQGGPPGSSFRRNAIQRAHEELGAERDAFTLLAEPGRILAASAMTLAGPTCDSTDVIACDYPMPALGVGDMVVSPMMGAYTTVTSSRFSGIAETPIVVANQVGRVGP